MTLFDSDKKISLKDFDEKKMMNMMFMLSDNQLLGHTHDLNLIYIEIERDMPVKSKQVL